MYSGNKIKILIFLLKLFQASDFAEASTCGGKTCLLYLQCSMDAAKLPQANQSAVLSAFKEARRELSCKDDINDNATNQTSNINDCLSFLSSPVVQLYFSLEDFQYPSRQLFWAKNQTGNFTWGRSQCVLTPDGSLAKLDTMVEVDILACVTKQTFGTFLSYTIGLQFSGNGRVVNKLDWMWQDDSKCILDNWLPGEPNKFKTDVCGAVHPPKNKWNNVYCSQPRRPSCSAKVRMAPIGEVSDFLKSDPTSNLTNAPSAKESGAMLDFQNDLQSLFSDVEQGTPLHITYKQTEVFIEKLQAVGGKVKSERKLQNTKLDFQFRAESNSSEVVVSIFENNPPATAVSELPTNGEAAREKQPSTYIYIRPSKTVFTSVTGYETSSNRTLNGTIKISRNVTADASQNTVCELFSSNSNLLKQQKFVNVQATCAFILPSSGNFSTVGCRTKLVGDQLTCTCNHFTIFSVLLAVKMVAISPGVKIASYICESLSVGFLVLTLALLVNYRKYIGSDRTILQINLSVALFMLHLTSLCHEIAVKSPLGCTALAGGTHFFLLATGSWFLVDGSRILMATQFPMKFRAQNPSKRNTMFLLIGWSAPTIITSLALGIGWHFEIYIKPSPHYTQCHHLDDQIQKYDRCWLTPGTNLFVLAVMIPVGIFVGASFIFAFVSSSVLLRKRPGANEVGPQETKEAIAKFFFLVLLLGGTWTIGFLAGVNDATSSLIFQYVHTVTNGLQGVFVFYFYCFLNSTIREKLRLFMRKRKQRAEEPPIPMVPINRRTQDTDM